MQTLQYIFAGIIAAILLILGIWGVFSENILGLFTLNIGHAMLHIILGIGGIIMVIGNKPANFNGTAGYLLTIFGVLGLIPGVRKLLADMLNINMNITYLWIAMGVASLIVYFLRPRVKRDPETGEVIDETDEETLEEVSPEAETTEEPAITTETVQETTTVAASAPVAETTPTPANTTTTPPPAPTPPPTPASDAAAASTPPTTNAMSPQPGQEVPQQQPGTTPTPTITQTQTNTPPVTNTNIGQTTETKQPEQQKPATSPPPGPAGEQQPKEEPFHYNPSTSADRAREDAEEANEQKQPPTNQNPPNEPNKV